MTGTSRGGGPRRAPKIPPRLAELAELVSLGSRVDASLLRAARLQIPGAGVELEAELWFSNLVGSRSVSGFTLDPRVLEILHANLKSRGRLDTAWQLVQARHPHLSEALQLEERLTWFGLGGGTTQEANDALLPAIRTLRQESRRGFELWAQRLVTHGSSVVMETKAGQLLAQEVALIRGGAPRTEETDWTQRVELLNRGKLNFRVVGTELQLGELRDHEHSEYLEVFLSRPNLLEVRWTDEDGTAQWRLAPWSPNRSTVLSGVQLPITLRHPDGSGHQILDREGAERHWVAQVQGTGAHWLEIGQLLESRGYDLWDGASPLGVRDALLEFQGDEGLAVDGLPGPATRAALEAPAHGDQKGESVKRASQPMVLIVHHDEDRDWANYLRSLLVRSGGRAHALAGSSVEWDPESGGPKGIRSDTEVLLVGTHRFFGMDIAHQLLTWAAERLTSMSLVLFPGAAVQDPLAFDDIRVTTLDSGEPDVVSALQYLEFDVEASVADPPALPLDMDDEEQEVVAAALEHLLHDELRAGEKWRISLALGAARLWATFTTGRSLHNAMVALMAALWARYPESEDWERLERILRRNESTPRSKRWSRIIVNVGKGARKKTKKKSASHRRLNFRMIERETKGLLAEAHRAATGGLVSNILARARLLKGLKFDTNRPSVLALTQRSAAPLFELGCRTQLVRTNPGFTARREELSTPDMLHIALGASGVRLVERPPIELGHIRELTLHLGQGPPPRILLIDVDVSVVSLDVFGDWLRDDCPALPHDGLFLMRFALGHGVSGGTGRTGGILDLPRLIEAVHQFCQDKGPDTVLVRLVDDARSDGGAARALSQLARGSTVGDTFSVPRRKHPELWFIWGDPFILVDIPLY